MTLQIKRFFIAGSVYALLLINGCDDPRRTHGRDYARNTCVNSLRSIQGSKETWMLENRKTTNDVPPDSDLFGSPPALMREKPSCPNGGTYTIGRVAEKVRCSVKGHTI
jgi:hypothetical protein